MTRLYDLTPPITEGLPVWPGDSPPRREVLLDTARGDNITLSTLHATVHLGAHADGPNHYGAGALGIETQPLDNYLGRCQVVRIVARPRQRITPDELLVEITEPRVLVMTGTLPDHERFHEDFAALDPGLVDFLSDRGVRLIGVDTPSVDLFESQELPAHQRCLARGVAILEGLDLREVPAGVYELIALPLRLVGFDASPVRAILRTLA